MAKPFKFADLYVPSVKKAMQAIYNGEHYDRAEVTADIATAIAEAIKKSEEHHDG